MEKGYFGTVTRLGNSNAVVIPAAILRSLRIRRGDKVIFGVYSDDGFFVKVLRPDDIRALRPPDIKIP